MRVLFVNNSKGRGGGEEFLRDLLPGLVQKGVQVGLVCRPGTHLHNMFQNSSVAVYPVERSGRYALTSAFTIAKVIRQGGYTIVNIQRGHDIIQSWCAALISLQKPVLLYTPQVPEFKKSRFLLRRMDKIVTISRHIAHKITSYLPSIRRRVQIIPYGIDLASFSPHNTERGYLRRRFGLAPGTKIIATVGDLWKNQIEFLDALSDIRKEIPAARFILVASETRIRQVQEFKDRVAELGLSDVVLWAGRLSKADMPSFYADIDLAVSTHRNEGFGIWILEALAMGKPVVAFDAGGVRDPLDGCPSGALVNGGSRDMAAEIISILKDDARYKRMSEDGPSWVAEKFTKERMIEDYNQYFHDLVSRS